VSKISFEKPVRKAWSSHGSGDDRDFKSLGDNVIIEPGARIFLARFISIEDNVYIGHDSIIKGYFDQLLTIGSGTWIGPQCFIYASAGIEIGHNVGIGPKVVIVTSQHDIRDTSIPILHSPLKHAPVVIGDDADIGCASIILPGVTIGKGAQIGAGSIVTRDVPAYAIAAGSPAKILRMRK